MRKVQYYGPGSLSLRFYDVLTELDRGLDGDIAFYGRGLGRGDMVLELGCGTGRVCLALAQMGVRVFGIDIAEGMIEQARRKLRQCPQAVAARVQFMTADMLSLDLPVRFRRVIVPFYTLNFLTSRARRAEAIRIAARHLAPGGEIMIHTIPLDRLRQQKVASQRPEAADVTVNFTDGTRLEVTWDERVVDADQQATRQRVIYRHRTADDLLLDESVEELVFSWISEKEIAVAATKAGLRIVEVRDGFQDGVEGREHIHILIKPD